MSTSGTSHDASASGTDGNGATKPQHPADEHAIPDDLPKPNTITVAIVALVFVLLLAGLFVLGWIPHHRQAAEAKADAAEQSSDAPVVGVARPKPANSSKDIVLPADIKPSQETAIYSRANGYLKTLHADIGDHVKSGQLLAEIDTPEVDAQLAQSNAAVEQAKANVTKSQSDLDLSKRTFDRYVEWQRLGTGGVTEQQLDEKRSAYNQATGALAAAEASVLASQADVQRLTVLQGYEKITAPFDGTITTRNYDVGALLSPSDIGPGKEMFHIAHTDLLNVYVNVPQTYATNIKTGQPAYLMVRNYPGKEFSGIVARSAGALDSNTRTLPFELHFANPDGTLYAGMYGQARLLVTTEQKVLTIPASALVFNAEGLNVALVRDDKVHFQKITTGRDLGNELEVTAGLTPEDQVVANPGERLREGVDVRVASPARQQARSE